MGKKKLLSSIIKLVSSLGWKICRPTTSFTTDCFIIGNEKDVDRVLELIHTPQLVKKVIEKPSIEWIQEYRELFPVGVRSGGFPVRGDLKGCIKKMEEFLETYPEYDKELILKVTKDYVERKKQDGYAYMQLAHYFIKKDDISTLASECENFKESVGQKETILNL